MKPSHLLPWLAAGLLIVSSFTIACSSSSEEDSPVAPSAPSPTVQKPAPPSNLLNVNNLDLAFTDHANNEDGFRVYKDGGLQLTLAPNDVRFTPTTCAGSFKVTAYNTGGESSATNTVVCHPGS